MYNDTKTASHRLSRSRTNTIAGQTLAIAGQILAIALIADFYGFAAWMLSGQPIPQSGYYLGRLTVEILRFIIG